MAGIASREWFATKDADILVTACPDRDRAVPVMILLAPMGLLGIECRVLPA
ncbi:MAG: hypothetical protein OEW15_05670 [Nitrospirota bacterium]|nr:hypothetical protein [Nitrospirota bacterium]